MKKNRWKWKRISEYLGEISDINLLCNSKNISKQRVNNLSISNKNLPKASNRKRFSVSF